MIHMITEGKMADFLLNFKEPKRIYPCEEKNAAILLPLIKSGEEWELLFEVRSSSVNQKGEVCFPGGRLAPEEKPEEAAVRETMEELLVTRDQIEVISPLHVKLGPGGAEVTSFLGILKDYQDTFSEEEVERVFRIPVSWFIENPPDIYQTVMGVDRTAHLPLELIPGGKDYPWKTIPYKVFFYKTREAVIWGMTAEFLYHYIQSILVNDRRQELSVD